MGFVINLLFLILVALVAIPFISAKLKEKEAGLINDRFNGLNSLPKGYKPTKTELW